MNKRVSVLALVIVLLVVAAVPAFAAGPTFGAAIYADNELWSTKGTADLPAPNDHDRQAYDGLFKFTNGVTGQPPVAEASPMNPNYNGGRWIEYNVTWNGTPELVTSYEQLHQLKLDGAVTIIETGNYFQCPLLPVKE
jgi:hypothetical protein